MEDNLKERFDNIQLFIEKSKNQHAVLEFQVKSTINTLSDLQKRQEKIEGDSLNYKMATTILQDLIDKVSSNNIKRIVDLVNLALKNIFFDMDLTFDIEQEVKRNLNTYKMVIIKDGVKGSINSFGGGVVATISMVLKILFNILSKKFPFLVYDESLGFLSSKYIPHASKFMKQLSDEFTIPILLVTHQPLFTEYSDNNLEVHIKDKQTVVEVVNN